MRRGYESVNISRAATLTNLFYLFFHGAKSALLPFLTLFFRLIGLTAFEAGCIIAAKTITGLVWAPLWARCASAYNRQRVILMFSLFMMMVTYLIFPALYTQLARAEHCSGMPTSASENASLSNALSSTTTLPAIPASPFSSTKTTHQPAKTKGGTQSRPTTASTSTASTTTSSTTASSTTEGTDQSPVSYDEAYNDIVQYLTGFGLSPDIILSSNMTAHDMYKEMKKSHPDLEVSEDLLETFLHVLRKKQEEGKKVVDDDSDGGNKERKKRSSSDWVDVDQIKTKLVSIQKTLQSDKTLLCLIVLAIVIAGEIFASPVEKVADDSWFDFLNRIDDLERYGQQRFWGSLAFVLVPIVVTIAVDHTPCFLPFHLHHFLLHFYIFAVLMAIALIISCCYPIPPPATSKYVSKIGKALRAICCDGRGFLFTVTLLFAGMVHASYHNFLFWRIQDLGGKETTMGLCVSAAAFAEIPMLIFSSRLVKRIGNCWTVSLSLLILSLRIVSYSFIP